MKLQTCIRGRNFKKKEENNVKVKLNLLSKRVSVSVLPADGTANYKDKKIVKIEKCLLHHHNAKVSTKHKIAKDSKKKNVKTIPIIDNLESLEGSSETDGSTCSKSRRPVRKIKNNKKYESDSEDTLKIKKSKTKRSKQSTNKIKNNQDLQIFEIEKVLRKKRNSERRKEKSRDAARCRRGKESEIFGELGALLPLEGPISSNLDKASIIRVAIAYLRTRSLVTWGLDIPLSAPVSASHLHQIDKKRLLSSDQGSCTSTDGVLQALDGFLIVLTNEGEVVYTSENIATFLGLSQIDVIGHPLLDYIHPCDHDEVRHLASLVSSGPNNTFLRFKCTLTPKGRNVNLKSATYKVVQVTGQVLNGKNSLNSSEESNLPSKGGNSWIVALGVPVPHPSNIEVPLDKQTFVSKHSLDMKFNYVDENVNKFCGYRPEDLLGRSLYQLNHALDTQLVRDAYKTLRSKGQVETSKYRFLAQGGGYVWVVTQATLISGHRDNRPQYVVCLNFVISGIEYKEIIFSECQLKSLEADAAESSDEEQQTSQQYRQQEQALKPSQCDPSFIGPVPLSVPSVLFPCEEELENSCVSSYSFSSPTKPAPVAATCSLLRDRTEDMNEGYLTFTDNDSHVTILKEEPEDLTHLAPSVGEDCVPLEVPVFLPVFDDVLENDRSGYSLISNNEDSIEKIFNEPFVTSSGIENTQSHSQQLPTRLCEISSKTFQTKAVSESLIQDCFRYTGDQNSSHCRKVPDQRIRSPQGSVLSPASTFGFDTPGSPFSPLLSQAASPPTPEKHRYILPGDPKPTPATTKLFADLDVDNSSGSSMDLFNNFDLKLEEDLELRAPYIPPIDEVLIFDQDDLFGLNSSSKTSSNNEIDNGHTKKDDFSFFSDNQKDEFLNGSTVRDSLSPNHPFNQSKNGNDTGGNFVDPNQVLPGQFYVKGDEKDNLQELRYLLEAPPPTPVKEPVDPPPPLKCSSSTPASIVFIRTGSKRPHSPSISSAKKWKSGFVSSTSTSLNQRKEQSTTSYSIIDHGKSELPTPRAPLMQQLLVSKEPIRIGGRVVSLTSNSPGQEGGRNKKSSTSSSSSGSTASSKSHTQSTHSVLRNLLVSGRDDRAGYAVVMSNLSGALEDDSKNVGGDKSDADSDSPLHSISNLPVNKDGKIELTRQQLSDLLDRAGAFRNGFRALPVAESMPPTPPESYSPVTPSTPVSEISKEDNKPFLMVDSSMSPIPTLFNLTSFDCEVNAPTQDPSLLQGSELLMALEHTQNNNNNK